MGYSGAESVPFAPFQGWAPRKTIWLNQNCTSMIRYRCDADTGKMPYTNQGSNLAGL
jgi:hypothetical protein